MFIGGALCDEKMKVKRSYLKVGFPVRSARTGTKDSNGPVACTTYSNKLLIYVLYLEEREMSFQIHNSALNALIQNLAVTSAYDAVKNVRSLTSTAPLHGNIWPSTISSMLVYNCRSAAHIVYVTSAIQSR